MNVQKRLLPAGTPPPQRPAPPPTTGRQVLRVNRACTSCRRQKMRCDGPDNPPCTRCRISGQQCIFEKVPKLDQLDSSSLERLTEVENEIAAVKNNQTTMQNTLNDILSELRRSNLRVAQQPSEGHTSSTSTTPGAGTPFGHELSAALTVYPAQNSHNIPGLRPTNTSEYTSTSAQASGSHVPPKSTQAGHHVTFAASTRPIHHSKRHSGVDTPHRDSGVSSPANSDVDIPVHALLAPIEVINDLAEAPADAGRPARKRKRTNSFGAEDYGMDSHRHSDHSGTASSLLPGGPDVIQKGLISEEEAKDLYSLYFSGCYRILAMFDPSQDTFEYLRQRSPFCFCCLLMVGAKVRDGGGHPSSIQLSLEKEALEIAKGTMFRPVKRVEVVQGLLLIAAWSYSTGGTGWITAGYAIRCAVDLGLHKALQRLSLRIKSGQAGDGEIDQNLVRACRTWCALFVFEYQLSFGVRRPAMMGNNAERYIDLARETLLKHPLSIPTDVRLVSTCQLLCIQHEIHQRLDFDGEETPNEQYTVGVLREAHRQVDAWQNEWDIVMSMNHEENDFFRSSAAIQRAYAHLFHNSLAVQHIRTKAQAKAISPENKALAFEAVEAAKEALNIVLHNTEYREGLRFAISYTHTCAAFAGGFLLRMARLFPRDFDINQTCALVESVARVLSEVPAKKYSETLYNMLNSLRQRQLANGGNLDIPTETISPQRHTEPSLPMLSSFTTDGLYPTDSLSGGPQVLDPLFPSWLTDLQYDGTSFLSGTDFSSHFG